MCIFEALCPEIDLPARVSPERVRRGVSGLYSDLVSISLVTMIFLTLLSRCCGLRASDLVFLLLAFDLFECTGCQYEDNLPDRRCHFWSLRGIVL